MVPGSDEFGLRQPNAMTLATVDQDGRPSARIVLLKGWDARGFVFFTNYRSRKGRELTLNPRAALLFHWIELERQVRIEGVVEMISREESDEYYASRPIGSRLGAWASPQSELIARREELESRLTEVSAKFGDNPPRPEHWGGYCLAADMWNSGRVDPTDCMIGCATSADLGTRGRSSGSRLEDRRFSVSMRACVVRSRLAGNRIVADADCGLRRARHTACASCEKHT